MKARGYALTMANKLPVLFKIMFNLAKKKSVHGASINPADHVQLFVTNNTKERYLTQAERERLLMAMDQSDNKQLK